MVDLEDESYFIEDFAPLKDGNGQQMGGLETVNSQKGLMTLVIMDNKNPRHIFFMGR